MARATAKATTPPAPTTAASRRPAETAPAPASRRARRDIFEATWTLFCSVRFAVVQILVLAAATTLGTLIPQMPLGLRDFPTDYNAFLTDMQTRFGAFSNAMLWSGMFDLYNSFWFRLLIIIQIYSIIICTLNRWGPIWRQINPTTIRSNEAFLRTMSERATFSGVPLAPATAAQALRAALGRSRYRVLEETDPTDGTVYLYADRDRWVKLVTFVSHAALVMLIVTAAFMSSSGWREQGLLFLPGTPVNVGHGTGWSVRSDKFETEYYPGTSSVKEFWTTLSVLQANTVVETKRIRVNDPLRYEGVNYFLVSTQTVASIIATTPAGDPLALNRMGQSGPITDTVGSATDPVLLTFNFTSEENLPMDFVQVRRPNTDTVTLQVLQYTDVARAPGEAPPLFVRAYVGQNFDQSYYNDFVPRNGELVIPELPGLRFSLKGDIAPILEVAKDADLTAIILWFSLMAGGFALSLYVTFQRCWIRITRPDEATAACDVLLGGLTDRNKVAFEREFERLAGRARDALATAPPG
jgi:cytochrome c biogenesis protein